MDQYRKEWHDKIINALAEIAGEKGVDISSFEPESLVAEIPPKPEYGDIAFPLFAYAKILRDAPPKIANAAAQKLSAYAADVGAAITTAGPYINIKLERKTVSKAVLADVMEQKSGYGCTKTLSNKRIMLEFSCPNTNKPLHLGHLRNDAIGESIGEILKKCGADLFKVIIINDRGIHICKSMLAYKKYGNNTTPETEGKKSDHFVGDFYVKFSQWASEDPEAENQAREMLRLWEDGDPETRALWEKMNKWALDGIKKTYEATDIVFDKYYYESQTYELGRDFIFQGLEKGIFFKKEDNSIWVDLTNHKLDEKVLLRADGTSLYLTQDIGTAVMRHNDWPFERLVYVVASEQNYHFKVLFLVLQMIGFEWAKNLYHLSYGMVNLPEGKMKSREGTVVDADDLIKELTQFALEEIESREREEEIEDVPATARKIALGALNYYLLAATPQKDIIFDPKESISFTGNTGPYLQYTGARISSILRKFAERKEKYEKGKVDTSLLTIHEEWEIIKLVSDFPSYVARAAYEMNPSVITGFLYDLAKLFSRYYHDNQVLRNDNQDIVLTRIEVLKAVLEVLKSGFKLAGIPFLEKM
ncbi:MAG: arginine--tRNA ligase [Spirochaetaceae bacterium]|nr:MAG: arginine--tRNA ligase [Spirochaetaceae bacterium]